MSFDLTKKRLLARSSRVARRATAALRHLPDVIIIGAQKAGTSSLYAYMAQHPDLLPSSEKEVHYFDGGPGAGHDTYRRGQGWYRAFFPMRSPGSGEQLAFEASPLYLFHPLAAPRMAHLLPEVRIIALLRNPVDRAISHYFHEVAAGRETWSIDDALTREEERLARSATPQAWEEVFKRFSYKKRGLYAEQLERYYFAFPRSQVLVLRAEDLFKRTEETLGTVFRFLGVDSSFIPSDLAAKNSGKLAQVVPAECREYLERYFEMPNRDLQRLLGQDLRWERRAS